MRNRADLCILATIVILVFCIAPTKLQAQHCNDYSYYLRWRAHVTPPMDEYGNSYARGVTVVGKRAYVAANIAGLAIYDVSDPVNPVLLGVADTPGACQNVAVAGNHAYVADWHSPGFCVVDVTDPAAPFVLGTGGVGGSPSYIEVAVIKPDTVGVLDYNYGMRMFDVSDPANPDMFGGIENWGFPRGLDVEGAYLYVTNGNDLRIYDMNVALHPDQLTTHPLPGPTGAIDVVGDFAYVACRNSGLQIVDVSDPTSPEDMGRLAIPAEDFTTEFIAVHVVGNLAYLKASSVNGSPGLRIVNVSDPAAPYMVNSLGLYGQNYGLGLFVADGYVYVSDENYGLYVADVSPTASPGFISSYVEQDFYPDAVAATGDYAYVLDDYFGLRVMDVTTTPAPTLLGTADLPGTSPKLVLEGNLAYVADYAGGLQIVDVTDPSSPGVIGSVAPPGDQNDVAVQGTLAYLASPTMGLQIVDVSDPTAPFQRGSVNPPGTTRGVAVDGDHAYLACMFNGLQVADISNPDAPSIIGELDILGWPENVHLARGHAFLCTMEDGLYIVDITNPAAPESVSTLVTPGLAWDVVVEGDLAYIADVQGGLQIADISDLSDPRYLGCVDTPNNRVYGVALTAGRVCLADQEGGLHVIGQHCVPSSVPEAEVPQSPLLLKAFPNPFNPQTTIAFELPAPKVVTLRVYDVGGRLVKEIVGSEQFAQGPHQVTWNGRDEAGRLVASGTFFCRLEAGENTETKRVALIK
jgi:hypothetical protein